MPLSNRRLASDGAPEKWLDSRPRRDLVAPPVSTWLKLGTFDSEVHCKAANAKLYKKVLQAYRREKAAGRDELIIGDGAECIASDNPVLKSD